VLVIAVTLQIIETRLYKCKPNAHLEYTYEENPLFATFHTSVDLISIYCRHKYIVVEIIPKHVYFIL
jgi:hypothetical protein